jgi:hypothetical protein
VKMMKWLYMTKKLNKVAMVKKLAAEPLIIIIILIINA